MRHVLCTIVGLFLWPLSSHTQYDLHFPSPFYLANSGLRSLVLMETDWTPVSSGILPDGVKWEIEANSLIWHNSDISETGIALAVRTDRHEAIHFFGSQGRLDTYRDTKLGLGYARRISASMDLGIRWMMNQISVDGYGRVAALGVEAGGRYDLGGWQMGLSTGWRQPIVGISEANPFFSLGTASPHSAVALLFGEWEYNKGHGHVLKAGIRYLPSDLIWFILSIRSRPAAPSFGVGLNIHSSIKCSLAFRLHPVLGTTYSLGLSYSR